MEVQDNEEQNHPGAVRELAEEVRKLAGRARGIRYIGETTFRLLPERDQAELLHNLSCIRRSAEAMLRKIEEGEQTGSHPGKSKPDG